MLSSLHDATEVTWQIESLKTDDEAQEASSPGSSGPGGSDTMGSFMDGGIVDLVDIYD